MSETIENDKFVELTYKIIDKKSGDVLTSVDFPLGYVHGQNDTLAPPVLKQLEGKTVGDVIEVPIDCNEIYGPRDEGLVFTDRIENVPEQYRELGTTITMENADGKTRNFIVTKIDDKSLTVDGNNPLCGREVIFKLDILTVREPTEEEFAAGGTVEKAVDVGGAKKVPV